MGRRKLIKLTEKQRFALKLLLQNKYTEILFEGGSRSGKTFIILLGIIMLCLQFPGLRVLITRKHFKHARSSIWEQTLLPMLITYGFKREVDNTLFIVKFPGGSEIWLGGLDDKERTEKVLGQEFAIIFNNEGTEISLSSRDIVKTRLAQKIKGFNNFMISDCNPSQPTHYLYKEFHEENKDYRTKLRFYPQDNKVNLPAGYIKNVLENLPEDKRKRFLEGVWAHSPGACYSNVKEENRIICERNILKFYDDIVIGIDWGLYMCAVVWGIKIEKPKIKAYCIHEIIVMNGVTQDLITELDKIVGLKKLNTIMYCDHEPDRIMELQSAGYAAKPAYKKSVGERDASVNEYELYFHKLCKYTFQSMINLRNQEDPSGQGFLYGKHVKENDHEADGSAYALHGWKMDNRVKGQGHYLLEENVI